MRVRQKRGEAPEIFLREFIERMVVTLRAGLSRSLIRTVFLGTLPIVLLLLFNVARFNRLTLAPVEGHLFALISPLSSLEEVEHQVRGCGISNLDIPPMKQIQYANSIH